MLTKITSAADRMMGSWIVAAVLLVLLAVASVTAEGNDPLAGVTDASGTVELAVDGPAAADEPARTEPASETVVAAVEADGFVPPEN